MPSRVPVPAEPATAAATDAAPDLHDRELRGLALALTDDAGFRLAIATFGDSGVRDVLIDRLAANLTAAGATLSCLDVASLVPPADQEARREFSLLAALRRHYEGLVTAQPETKSAISVVGLEHFISEFSEGGLNALATANLQRELFPQVCPLPVVLWLPPWATTLLAQTAPDLWHWRTATFDFPGGGPPPSALSAWPDLTREEWWRPVDGERLQELRAELDTVRRSEGADTSPRARAYAAHLRVRLADALYTRGQLDEAFNLLKEAGAIFAALGDVRYVAVTMGKIADTLVLRGQLDEALRILKEKVLPAFEPLGDVRSRAVTMGKIADVLQARGQLDEALRISKEEELPIYERLGDVRERAVAMGRIAGILQARGQLDEALRIRKEEQLPVYERLGDVRSRAVTMGNIAGILQARGQLDEALRIRKEEQLPVYERLGDLRERAVTMGRIADILQARGQLEEALRIRKEEELPVYERLGDVHSRAVTMGKIADILQARGELDEALRIRKEEVVPVFERLGDVHARAATMGKIADILARRGQLAEALRILKEEVVPVFERLGYVREIAVGRANLAITLLKRNKPGDRAEAKRLLCLALADASRLRLPEAATIEKVLADAGFTCD